MSNEPPNKELTEEQRIEVEKKIEEWKDKKQKLFKKYDSAFKIIGVLFVISGLGISLYNIPTFREYAAEKKFFVAPLDSVILWSLIGFFFHYVGRKIFFKLTNEFFKKRLHPKIQFYPQDQQKQRLINLVKQTYEGFFHMTSAFTIFWLFRDQDWFPQMMGGSGSCSRIFQTYPHWPVNHGESLLYFYEFMLGTYIFLTLDLVLFDYQRYKTKNFGELFYHHFVTILLISISLFYNFVPIGITVLFVHDGSDFLRGFTRMIGESTLAVKNPKGFKVFNYFYLGMFVYFRVVVLPFCLIDSMYSNNPSQFEEWSFLSPQCAYLIVISCAIYSIQCYWAYFIYNQIPIQMKKNEYFAKRYDNELKGEPSSTPQNKQEKKEDDKNDKKRD